MRRAQRLGCNHEFASRQSESRRARDAHEGGNAEHAEDAGEIEHRLPEIGGHSQCRAEAGARRASMSMSVGLANGNRSASEAATNTKIVHAIAVQNSVPSRRVRLIGLTATSSSMLSSSVAMTDPGVEDGIEHVD